LQDNTKIEVYFTFLLKFLMSQKGTSFFIVALHLNILALTDTMPGWI